MHVVNIHEAKTQLSRYIERVVGGETIVIAKAGKPLVRMTAFEPTAPPIGRIGFLRGDDTLVPDDFDAMGVETIEGLFSSAS